MFGQLPVPQALYADNADPCSQSTGATTANTAFFESMMVWSPCSLSGFRFRFGNAGNGHCDLGLYDVNGNRLVSLGSQATVTGTQTFTLATALNLSVGVYWLAFWIDNNTDQITKSNGNGNNVVCQQATTTNPLPTSKGSLTLSNATIRPIILGLLVGGWS